MNPLHTLHSAPAALFSSAPFTVTALAMICLVTLSGCGILDAIYNDPEDESVGDVGISDTDVPDTGVPDTGVPDTDVPDTDVPDADPDDCPTGADTFEFEGEFVRLGDSCGPCEDGELVCDETEGLRCEGASEDNGCGGCTPLENLGDSCGPCELDRYECDGSEAVICDGETECPQYLSTEVDVQDVTTTSATFHGEIIEPPPSSAEVGFCWDTEFNPVDTDINCHSLGEATELGDFSQQVEGLEPDVEYHVQAYLRDNIDGEILETSTPTTFWTLSEEVSVADADNSSIWSEGGPFRADDVDEGAVFIELRDASNDPVVNIKPEFEASGDGNDYTECSETNTSGIAVCSMTSTTEGEKTLSIVDPVAVTGGTIEFISCNESGSPFGGGEGTEGDPYRLCAPQHLNAIGADENCWEKHFLVMGDIDVDGDFKIIGVDEDSPFTGSFDGRGFTIEHLMISAYEDYVGLFGYTDDARIENVALEDVDVSGSRYVGGLVGKASETTITTSYVSGNITADSQVGGLVGELAAGSTISESFATGTVSAAGSLTFSNSGGLVGYVEQSSTVSDCYATGSVSGHSQIGGLVGNLRGNVDRCYASGFVESSNGDQVGGLAGYVVSNNNVQRSYWDETTTDQEECTCTDGAAPMVTADFDQENSFNFWNFSQIWTIGTAPDGEQRPILQWQDD